MANWDDPPPTRSKCGQWIPRLLLSIMTPTNKIFHPENILDLVNNLRSDGAAASFCFGTAESPLSGKQCLIYVVRFPNSATWGVRVPVHINHFPPEAIASLVEDEVSILSDLEASGFRWSPRLLCYDSLSDKSHWVPVYRVELD